jgi:flagellar biosynthesis protein FliR
VIEPLVIFFSLVLARVSFFVATLPLLGGQQTPRLVKVGLSLALAVMWSYTFLEGVGSDTVLREAQNVAWLSWSLAVAREAVLGALFGFVFSLCLIPARVAGDFISQEIGLSFGNQVAMSGSGSDTPLTVILDLFSSMLFFHLNIHHLCLSALHRSFQQFPIGQNFQIPICDAVGQATSAQEWGLMVAAPVVVCLFLTTVILALLTRAAPQLNLYTVGFPLRIIVGIAALLVFLPQLLGGLETMMAQFADMLAGMV